MQRILAPLPWLVAVFVVTNLAANARANQDSAMPQVQLVNVEFSGGTVADYVRSIREALPGANVVMTPDAEFVELEPVALTDVDMNSAMELLDGLLAELPDRTIELSMQQYASIHGMPVYVVSARSSNRGYGRGGNSRPMPKAMSGVWSVSSLLQRDIEAQDIATAIDTALSLFGDDYPPAVVRFHPESGLVLARGSVEQHNAIEAVIHAMETGANDGVQDEEIESLHEEMREFQALVTDATRQRQDVNQVVERELEQVRTRIITFEQKIQRLQMAFDEVRAHLDNS